MRVTSRIVCAVLVITTQEGHICHGEVASQGSRLILGLARLSYEEGLKESEGNVGRCGVGVQREGCGGGKYGGKEGPSVAWQHQVPLQVVNKEKDQDRFGRPH